MTFEDLKLYAKNPGTYTITAIFDGNDEYRAKQTTFIMIVSENPEEPPTIIPLPTQSEPQPAVLTFDDNIVEYVQDIDTNTYDIQLPNNPNNIPLIWSCNSNNVTFDFENGKIYIPNVGEYIITVTFSGDDEYTAITRSYTLRITDDNGNVVVDKPRYYLYFAEELIVNYPTSNNTYYFQAPSTRRTNDNVVPQEILDLCYYTIGTDDTHITTENFVVNDAGTYTIYLHFTGNDDWQPETIKYIFNLREEENELPSPELSFSRNIVEFDQPNINDIYVLQQLNNPNKVSPITWSVTSQNSDYIVLYPNTNMCFVSKPGSYTITARFNGNLRYRAQSVSYNLVVTGTYSDATIYYERPSDTYRIEESIGNGYTVAMPKLINPFQLPYTIYTSTNDIMVETTDGEYDLITFFTPVKNAVVEARFVGNDIFDPMTATYTVTLISLADRKTPRIEFQNPIERPNYSQNGVYVLQRIYSPDIPKTSLVWSVNAVNEGYYFVGPAYNMDLDHQLYTDGWNEYTITVTFIGDDDWNPASASYTMIPLREEENIELRVDNEILYLYYFDEEYSYYEVDPQPCYLYHDGVNMGEVSVTYTFTERIGSNIFQARGILYDEENNKFVISRVGIYYITARFEGNDMYSPVETTYRYYVTEDADPNIIRRQIIMEFAQSIDYVEYGGDNSINSVPLYYIPRPLLSVEDPYPESTPLEELQIDYSVMKFTSIPHPSVPSDAGAIFSSSFSNTLACDGIGVCYIKASFYGDRYYLPAEAYFTLFIWKADVEPVDIDLLFNGVETYNFVTSDNKYRLPRAAWKLSSEPEGNYYQNWKYYGLDINYSCSDQDATIEFGDDIYDGTITLPNGEGYYMVTATFEGNMLFNPASSSRVIKVGNVELVEKDPLLSFDDVVYNVDENWPDNLYAFQTLNNPYNIPSEELHWSIAEADGTPIFTQSIEIRDGQIYVYDIRYDVVVTVTYDGNIDQYPNTLDIYAPKTISYTMHVVPEAIVKRDVNISFSDLVVDWSYDEYNNVWLAPQSPILSESMPLVWSINNGGIVNGEFIYENKPTGTTLIEIRNPNIKLNNAGTYTVTATFVGDRYRNEASASYTINLAYNYASVYFANEVVTVELDTSSGHYYYPIQAVTKPNDIEVTYYLYIDENTRYTINQAQGCDAIGSTGDWEIRAYWTEYGETRYTSYTLRVIEAAIPTEPEPPLPEKINPTLSFTKNTISHDLYSDGNYFTPQTLNNPDNLTVRYILSEGITESNGYYNIQNIGTYTITAIFDGDDTYNSWAGSYNINVTNDYNTYVNEYLTFESLEDNNEIGWCTTMVGAHKPQYSIYWSLNKNTWNELILPDAYSSVYITTLNSHQKIYFKGNHASYRCKYDAGTIVNPISYDNHIFATSKKINISGNIMSMIYGDDFNNKTSFKSWDKDFDADNNFWGFFQLTKVVDASKLVLPATTLTNKCYVCMFQSCNYLEKVPIKLLPATSLSFNCYGSMFYRCPNITIAPELPATTLADYCYQEMFEECTSLIVAPELPATTLADYCYQEMFKGCTSLVVIPELLPATTLTDFCYESMFYDCTNITIAPELPATILVKGCYQLMFFRCRSLNYIKMLATNISAQYCLSSWLINVSSYGTFIKKLGTTIPNGSSGIPDNWEIQEIP